MTDELEDPQLEWKETSELEPLPKTKRPVALPRKIACVVPRLWLHQD
jgi:hypothetical protein